MENLDRRGEFDVFNQNQMREILMWSWYDNVNNIGGVNGGMRKEVDEEEVNIRVPLRGCQVHEWVS